MAVDYAALAQQYGGTTQAAPAAPSSGIDYSGLAAKYGANTPAAPASSGSFLSKASDAVSSIFPGKAIGTALGHSVRSLGDLFTGNYPGFISEGTDPSMSPVKVGADAANIALTAGSPLIAPASIPGRIAANTALGAGMGASNVLSEGGSPEDALKAGGEGALTNGLISGASEGVAKVASSLPTWLTKSAMPKIKDATVPYALDNSVVGPTKRLLAHSDQAVSSYGQQIKAVLQHPSYANETGDASGVTDKVLQAFPNSKLDADTVHSIVSKVAPASATLVDRVSNGTATLAEQNTLRQQLDAATKKVFTDSPNLTYNKQVAHEMANALRSNVQTTAPETKPIFANFSKEMDLNRALSLLDKKNNLKPTFTDLASAYAGYRADGIPGAMAAVVGERTLKSGAARFSLGQILSKLGSVGPATSAAVDATKSPIVKLLTNRSSGQ